MPIYAAKLTIGLIKNKLEEHGLASSAIFHEIRPRQKVTLGCFTVEPIHVNHSIPDSLAFAIDCPAGVVIHTGDFKVDYTPLSGDAVTDLPTIAEYGRKGVLALLADSTNAERPGFTATEQTVAEGVRRLFVKAGKRRIIVATFASNIYRVQQIIDLAIESGRKVAVSGRSMVSEHRDGPASWATCTRRIMCLSRLTKSTIPAGEGRAHHHRQPGRAAERAVPHGAGQPPSGARRPQ